MLEDQGVRLKGFVPPGAPTSSTCQVYFATNRPAVRIAQLVDGRPFDELERRLLPEEEIVDLLLDLRAHDFLDVVPAQSGAPREPQRVGQRGTRFA